MVLARIAASKQIPCFNPAYLLHGLSALTACLVGLLSLLRHMLCVSPHQVAHDHAQAFVPFSDGTSVEEIEALFKRLGRIGNGLYELMQKCPSMGKLFGAWASTTCQSCQSMLLHLHTVT
jgi:hypothetical protein